MKEILKEINKEISNKRVALSLVRNSATPEVIKEQENEIQKLDNARRQVMVLMKEEEIENDKFKRR